MIDRIYDIDEPEFPYKNAIISSNADTQIKIIQHGFFMFGNAHSHCYELVDTVQCVNCAIYGHYARNCKIPTTCKICSGPHSYKDCPKSGPPKCINCIAANKNGNDFNTRHRATDDRCPVRINRIDGIKCYLVSKN